MNNLYIIGYMEVADNKRYIIRQVITRRGWRPITGREKVDNNENKP